MIGLIRLVSFLPLRGAHGLGWLIGVAMWYSRGGSAKVVMRNLELCFPDQTLEERKKMAKDSLIALGKTYGEMGDSVSAGFKKMALPLLAGVASIQTVRQIAATTRAVAQLDYENVRSGPCQSLSVSR